MTSDSDSILADGGPGIAASVSAKPAARRTQHAGRLAAGEGSSADGADAPTREGAAAAEAGDVRRTAERERQFHSVRPPQSNVRSKARRRAMTIDHKPGNSAENSTRARPRRQLSGAPTRGLRLHRQQAFALQLLAGELAGAAHGLGLLAGALLRGLLVMAAELHLTENAFALHLLLQRLESLIDIIVADENLHEAILFLGRRRPGWRRCCGGENSRSGADGAPDPCAGN